MKKKNNKILHVISKVATPHNNILMKALDSSGLCSVKLYYSLKSDKRYLWKDDVFNSVGDPVVIGEKRINWTLVWYALTHPEENYMFIGWPNNTARVLIVIFWLLKRSFLFWSDMPVEWSKSSQSGVKYPFYISTMRKFFYHIVKTRSKRIFLVGRKTIEVFQKKGFPEYKLSNLPIFVQCDRNRKDYIAKCKKIRFRYGLTKQGLLFISGSRLTESKGFGDLIRAVKIAKKKNKNSFKVVIVGKGEQEETLREIIAASGLKDVVILENWMQPDEFESLIACSDIYIHPARFDAFGGGTLHAMALGVPIIGSDGAGVVIDRVENMKSGLIFHAGDIDGLAKCILFFLKNNNQIENMGLYAIKTAQNWPPTRGVRIIFDELI